MGIHPPKHSFSPGNLIAVVWRRSVFPWDPQVPSRGWHSALSVATDTVSSLLSLLPTVCIWRFKKVSGQTMWFPFPICFPQATHLHMVWDLPGGISIKCELQGLHSSPRCVDVQLTSGPQHMVLEWLSLPPHHFLTLKQPRETYTYYISPCGALRGMLGLKYPFPVCHGPNPNDSYAGWGNVSTVGNSQFRSDQKFSFWTWTCHEDFVSLVWPKVSHPSPKLHG